MVFVQKHTIYCVWVDYFLFCQTKKTIENSGKRRETEK